MKALTLTQPWATLVAIGAKKIETRSWNTSYRGQLAIHAAKSFPADAKDICLTEPFLSVLQKERLAGIDCNGWISKDLPLGCIVAVCNLVHVKQMEEQHVSSSCKSYDYQGHQWTLSDQERAFGWYSVGRYMWLLDDIVALPEPIPVKGAQRLWEWKSDKL